MTTICRICAQPEHTHTGTESHRYVATHIPATVADRVPDLARVRLVRDVDRYPHFIAKAGMEGTVVASTPEEVRVCMDDEIDGCEEWSNEIIWNADDATDNGYPRDARYPASADLEVI